MRKLIFLKVHTIYKLGQMFSLLGQLPPIIALVPPTIFLRQIPTFDNEKLKTMKVVLSALFKEINQVFLMLLMSRFQ